MNEIGLDFDKKIQEREAYFENKKSYLEKTFNEDKVSVQAME